LGAFFDFNGDNRYDPCDGDYPAIEVKGCPTEANFPDEIVFWVYNDAVTATPTPMVADLHGSTSTSFCLCY
jgi:hypothetical protein